MRKSWKVIPLQWTNVTVGSSQRNFAKWRLSGCAIVLQLSLLKQGQHFEQTLVVLPHLAKARKLADL